MSVPIAVFSGYLPKKSNSKSNRSNSMSTKQQRKFAAAAKHCKGGKHGKYQACMARELKKKK